MVKILKTSDAALLKLGYLGPRGTFSDQAAQADRDRATLHPYGTFAQVIAALLDGEIDSALLPIENSSEGPINEVVDALIRHEELVIVEERVLTIEQNLIGVRGVSLDGIKVVVSIPQPLAQSRRWLDRHLPHAERRTTTSTARAVEMLSEDTPEIAAIGTRIAAEIYGRQILAPGIQDNQDNVTRFVTLKRAPVAFQPATGHDRTTLVIAVADQPGALVKALGVFDALEVNMSKIESRPRIVSGRPSLFREAIFHIDLDGHLTDPVIEIALQALQHKCEYLRVAGSYPKAPVPTPRK